MSKIEQLQNQIAALTNELESELKNEERIDASDILASEAAKRALLIAVAGSHSILFVGAPGVGKSMLRRVCSSLDHHKHHECLPCPCGYRNHMIHSCKCTVEQVESHAMPRCDITVEVIAPASKEFNVRYSGTSTAEIEEQIKQAGSVYDDGPTKDATVLLDTAYAEMGLSPSERTAIISIAETIAALGNSQSIEACHMMEAINYRPFLR